MSSPGRLVIRNARALTACGAPGDPLGIVDGATVVIEGGAIVAVHARPAGAATPIGPDELDAAGRLVSPGLIDCHTHPIFAGDRSAEFALRARGATYLEIAAAGGGIIATTAPTRAASDDELARGVHARLAQLAAGGVTTVEAKSGYDLRPAGELRLLRVLRDVATTAPVRLEPTLLCHLVPSERRTDRAAYVEELARELVPAAAREGLATSVDVYCDDGAFSLDEAAIIWRAAVAAGLAVRGHVGQFTDVGAAEQLAGIGARSADHLEQVSPAGIAALAAAGTVAVMLPGACVQLRLPVPPVAALRAAGVAMAVATDVNPGSSYGENLALQMWLATTHFGMTVEEAWLGVTAHAARALGRPDLGQLRPGARADLVLWDAETPAEIPYRYGRNLATTVVRGGVVASPPSVT
jgi:imidazolonepropionase